MSRRHARTTRPYWVHSQDTLDPEQVAHDAATAPDNPPCPGPCNRAYEHATITPTGEHLDPDNQVIEAVPGQPIWCRPCADRITRDLARLPDLAAGITHTDGTLLAGRSDSDRTRKASGATAPSLSPALDLLDELGAWADETTERLADDLGLPRPRVEGTRARVHALTGHVAWLVRHGTALLAHDTLAVEVGGAGGDKARPGVPQWVARLTRASGMDRLRHRVLAPCPSCDVRALGWDDGTEQVDCAACGRSFPQAEYPRLAVIVVDEMTRQATQPPPAVSA